MPPQEVVYVAFATMYFYVILWHWLVVISSADFYLQWNTGSPIVILVICSTYATLPVLIIVMIISFVMYFA